MNEHLSKLKKWLVKWIKFGMTKELDKVLINRQYWFTIYFEVEYF